jgi:N-acetylmuramoyl-L-alanine amidase
MSGELAGLGIDTHGAGQFANGRLLQATMPSTLVDAVFLTNNDEAARLAAGTRQVDIASAIAAGIDAWTLSVTAAGRGN